MSWAPEFVETPFGREPYDQAVQWHLPTMLRWLDHNRNADRMPDGTLIGLLENVAALLRRGMGRVLGDLAALGHDAEWDCIPASHVGAPHGRDRIAIVTHAIGSEWRDEPYRGALGRMGRQQQSVPWDRPWESALRELRGMDDGTAYRVDRVDTIRNAVVPQVFTPIGQAILNATDHHSGHTPDTIPITENGASP